ncbi:hypothetical protein OIDMADRAFT_145637 [Oidiodendron maius Zn]|uniref:Uncharacterized protein n=1 Tax=Oidiodendron maius (strain Zn) TaxID=913774 RepID=A0A0C3HA83_OIDMZ|nr:hypothetical protein OIDMADRAFT_145637 [Oidiodendron maius Zn]
MAELAFIPFDGQDDTKKRKKKREAIRVHVMKNFHRQRKREAAQHRINRVYEAQHEGLGGTAKDSNPSTVANAACRQGLSDSLIECYGDENSASLSIPDYSSLANFRSDRSLLPIFQAHEFIDQHVAHVEQSSALLSSNPKFSPLSTDWLPASRAHSHLFHASVFVCTASTETLAQRALSPSSFYHRGLAIRMINEQLSDSVQCMSDETIAAIISLANFECIIGNTSSLKYHVTGLLQLAAMRGGLDQLGMNGLLKRLILIKLPPTPHPRAHRRTTSSLPKPPLPSPKGYFRPTNRLFRGIF